MSEYESFEEHILDRVSDLECRDTTMEFGTKGAIIISGNQLVPIMYADVTDISEITGICFFVTHSYTRIAICNPSVDLLAMMRAKLISGRYNALKKQIGVEQDFYEAYIKNVDDWLHIYRCFTSMIEHWSNNSKKEVVVKPPEKSKGCCRCVIC